MSEIAGPIPENAWQGIELLIAASRNNIKLINRYGSGVI